MWCQNRFESGSFALLMMDTQGEKRTRRRIKSNPARPYIWRFTHFRLLHQICSQLLQRPEAHSDQLLRRRKSHLANLLHDIRKEFPRPSSSTVIGIPYDRIDATEVEPMENLAYPCGGATAVFSDLLVRTSPARQQDSSRMTAVDSVGQLSFHTFELLSLPGLELPCHNFVHDLFSTFHRLLPAA